MFILIGFIIILLLVFLTFEPKLDTIIINGKKKKIVWYNSGNGRNWMFLI